MTFPEHFLCTEPFLSAEAGCHDSAMRFYTQAGWRSLSKVLFWRLMTGVRTSPPCRPACLGHLTPNAPPRKWARRRYVFCIVPRSVTVASIRSLKGSSRYTFPLFKLLCGFSCVIGPRPTQNRGQKYLRGHTAPLPAGLFAFGVQNETALDHCLLDHRPRGRLRVCTERFPCRCT